MANGVVRGAVFQFGDVAVYSCFGGYTMEGVGRSRCLENGTWTPPPTCRGSEKHTSVFDRRDSPLFPGHFLLHLTVPFANSAALLLSLILLGLSLLTHNRYSFLWRILTSLCLFSLSSYTYFTGFTTVACMDSM